MEKTLKLGIYDVKCSKYLKSTWMVRNQTQQEY